MYETICCMCGTKNVQVYECKECSITQCLPCVSYTRKCPSCEEFIKIDVATAIDTSPSYSPTYDFLSSIEYEEPNRKDPTDWILTSKEKVALPNLVLLAMSILSCNFFYILIFYFIHLYSIMIS